MLIIAVLVAEIVITLMDFVEEDMSRKLPASERINHTLLAINYGAILVLLLPVLIAWAAQPTGITVGVCRAAQHRWRRPRRSAPASCGLRDFAASRRLGAHDSAPATGLVEALPGRQTVLVTGATGFIGSRLVAGLDRRRPSGHRAGPQSREGGHAAAADHADHQPRSAARRHAESTPSSIWRASRSATGCGPKPSAAAILDSRMQHDRRCRQADRAARTQAGRAGQRLGDRLVRAVAGSGADRSPRKPHACFSHELCDAWETRRRAGGGASACGWCCLRIGLVLGTEGGFSRGC